MFSPEMTFTKNDAEAAKILASFLPDRIFDTHCHLIDSSLLPELAENPYRLMGGSKKYRAEMSQLLNYPKEFRINAIAWPEASMKDRENGVIDKNNDFLINELHNDDAAVGEIIVHPLDTREDIEKKLVSPKIRGFKCYHSLSGKEVTWDAEIADYLPESVWEIANEKNMVITLHMVRDAALYDENNMRYIREMSKRFPNAVLILAHCARSFSSWTGVESVDKLWDRENVFFDFSAVCESPVMIRLLKKIGVGRCLWGSDWPVCRARGKCISLGNSFYWIYQKDIDSFRAKTKICDYTIGIENLMAIRQAFIISELKENAVEDFFYNNAAKLFETK